MTQKDKRLNCLNCRIGDFKHSLCDCHNGFCAKYKGIGKQEDFFMAIEALSKPNYESDNEVRLAVTNRNKDKVVLWDAFGEVEYYPNGEINCVHCPRYYETEDDIGVHSHCKSHGRLIDADALMEYCENQKSKTISNNDIARFPTISTDRPHGEWIDKGDYAVCSECGGSSGTQSDGVERIPRITTFCPHCGAKMTKGGGSE